MKFKITSFINKLSAKPAVNNYSWLEHSDGADDLAIIEKSTQVIADLVNNDELTDADRLEQALIIDEKNQRRLKDITTQFSKVEALKAELEKKTFDSAYYYYRQLFNLYQKLIINFFESHQKETFSYNKLALLFASALRVASNMIKWRLFAQQTPPDKLWMQVHILYQLASEESLLNQEISVYPDEEKTTINSIYIYACMIDALSAMSFPRQQVEFVATLLNQWLGKPLPDATYTKNLHVMMTDFSQDRGGYRIRMVTDSANFRFWEVDVFCKKVNDILVLLQTNKDVSSFELPNHINIKLVPDVLKRILAEWSKTDYQRQRRHEERFNVSKVAVVAHGLEAVTAKVRAMKQTNDKAFEDASKASLDVRLATAAKSSKAEIAAVYDMGIGSEKWQIVNESPKGFGAIAVAQPDSWVKQGALIALAFSKTNKTNFVGVIRFNKQLKTNEFQIGVELFSSHALYAQVTHAGAKADKLAGASSQFSNTNYEIPLSFSALYIPMEEGVSVSNSVILPRLEFKANSDYVFTIAAKTTTVRVGEAIETKGDWTRAMCFTAL